MELAPFSSVDPHALRWLRIRESPDEYRLLAQDTPVAVLTWAKHPGSLATVATATDRWTLKRQGFLNPGIGVRPADGSSDIARLSAHWNYHRIDVAGGASYRFHRAGMLVPAWAVETSSGAELVHSEPVRTGHHLEGGAVLVSADGSRLPDALLLIVLSWYFIVLAWFEDTAVETLASLEGPDPPIAPG